MASKLFKSVMTKVVFFVLLIIFIIVIVKLQDSITLANNDSYQVSSGVNLKIGDALININFEKFKVETIHYVKTLFSGSLGRTNHNKKVSQYIMDGLPKSMTLLLGGIIFSVVFGILKGVVDSKRDNKKPSTLKLLSTLSFISMPDIFAVVLVQGVIIWLYKHGIETFPIVGADSFKHAILPIITLSLIPVAYIARITTLSFDRIYKQDYIKTATGKGASEFRITWVHVFRNAIVEIIGSFSSITTILISSLLVVEYLFLYPGLGLMIYMSNTRNETNTVIGLCIVLGLVYLIIDLIFKILSYILVPGIEEN